jgi:hypothetical protein
MPIDVRRRSHLDLYHGQPFFKGILVEEMNDMHSGDEEGCHRIGTGLGGGELDWNDFPPWKEALYLSRYI